MNLQLGFVQPCRRELRACRWLSGLDFFSPLQYWTLLVLQNRMDNLQMDLQFFSPAEENKRPADLWGGPAVWTEENRYLFGFWF